MLLVFIPFLRWQLLQERQRAGAGNLRATGQTVRMPRTGAVTDLPTLPEAPGRGRLERGRLEESLLSCWHGGARQVWLSELTAPQALAASKESCWRGQVLCHLNNLPQESCTSRPQRLFLVSGFHTFVLWQCFPFRFHFKCLSLR